MTLRSILALSTIATASLFVPTQAAADPFDHIEAAINPEALLKGVIREDDVTLFFKHLRESMAASARGEEARESEAFAKRKAEISRDMAARGSVMAGALLTALEQAAKEAVREAVKDVTPKRAPPSAKPSTPAPQPY